MARSFGLIVAPDAGLDLRNEISSTGEREQERVLVILANGRARLNIGPPNGEKGDATGTSYRCARLKKVLRRPWSAAVVKVLMQDRRHQGLVRIARMLSVIPRRSSTKATRLGFVRLLRRVSLAPE